MFLFMTLKVSRQLPSETLYSFYFLIILILKNENGKDTKEMKAKRQLIAGVVLIILFAVWTVLIQFIDVQPIGVNSTDVGFADFNAWFHSITGVNMMLYTVTDWLGLVPIFVCLMFGAVGFAQLTKRKSLLKVDADIILLGVYYVMVIAGYLVFEMIPINYRPILINGFMEASYPSSTTLLVLSVMPTLSFQINRRLKSIKLKKVLSAVTLLFSVFMVAGRLVSGVHWATDIIGSVLLSMGLFCFYKGVVLLWSSTKSFRS